MHPSLLRIVFALALAATMAAPAFGQTIVVPNGNANVTGNDTSGPLPGGVSLRFQTVIDPDQFPSGPINITGFTFRAAPGKGAVNVSLSGSIYLSTSPNWANSAGHPLMSTTFANNVGSDNTPVVSLSNFQLTGAGCTAPGPCPFANNIVFTTPFPYDRANGPLLIDGQFTAFAALGTGEFDVITCLNTSCAINSVSAVPVGAATGTMNDDPRFGGSSINQITYTPATIDLNQHGLTGSWYEAATGGQGIEVEVFAESVVGNGVDLRELVHLRYRHRWRRPPTLVHGPGPGGDRTTQRRADDLSEHRWQLQCTAGHQCPGGRDRDAELRHVFQRPAVVHVHRRYQSHRNHTADAPDTERDLLRRRARTRPMGTSLFPGTGSVARPRPGRDSRPRSTRLRARSLRPGTRTCRTAPPPARRGNAGTPRKAPLRRACGRFR